MNYKTYKVGTGNLHSNLSATRQAIKKLIAKRSHYKGEVVIQWVPSWQSSTFTLGCTKYTDFRRFEERLLMATLAGTIPL